MSFQLSRGEQNILEPTNIEILCQDYCYVLRQVCVFLFMYMFINI